MQEQKNEGCQVYGFLEVNKVPGGNEARQLGEPGWESPVVDVENERKCPPQVAGNFHFAPGKSFQQSHVHGE